MLRQISDTCTAMGSLVNKPHIQISFLSYLLRGEKNVLIDTVPVKSVDVWAEELLWLLLDRRLDALILNHSEEDHSGALPILLSWFSDLPIYCTAACRERLKDAHPRARFVDVEDGDTIEIGDFRFSFIHTPGLHWDDNMVTFFENEKTLFSNDLYGQYLACEALWDRELSAEEVAGGSAQYFDKVFAGASAQEKQVLSRISSLAPEKTAPGHGVVLTGTQPEVFALYADRCRPNG